MRVFPFKWFTYWAQLSVSSSEQVFLSPETEFPTPLLSSICNCSRVNSLKEPLQSFYLLKMKWIFSNEPILFKHLKIRKSPVSREYWKRGFRSIKPSSMDAFSSSSIPRQISFKWISFLRLETVCCKYSSLALGRLKWTLEMFCFEIITWINRDEGFLKRWARKEFYSKYQYPWNLLGKGHLYSAWTFLNKTGRF